MSSSALIEVLGRILFGFTRGVTEHYNPDEPEFTAESFGYNPLESTGREWYYQPVDELIYQEYSVREATSLTYLASSSLDIKVIDACSPDENEESPEHMAHHDHKDITMAWKRLRPSVLCTVRKSMYIGALISIVTAIFIGTIYMMVTYLSFKTVENCEFHLMNSTSTEIQWMRIISNIVSCIFLYIWFFVLLQFLFRPFQLMGVKGKLLVICFLTYSFDTIYRVALQALGISHSKLSNAQDVPLKRCFLLNQCLQTYVLTNYFCKSSRQKVTLFFQMVVPSCLGVLTFFLVASLIYPVYNEEDADGKLLIAIFAPLAGVFVKVTSRICVQKLYNITHPGYSYVFLSPLYCGAAIVFRILQADLGSLLDIAILGIVHGAAEVLERSTIVLLDHIVHTMLEKRSAPWGSFRTPRRERLMADIAIMSMLFESTAIVSVNGYLYLYQFIYLRREPFVSLLQLFYLQFTRQFRS